MPANVFSSMLGRLLFVAFLVGLGVFLLWLVAFVSHWLLTQWHASISVSTLHMMGCWLSTGIIVVFVLSVFRRLKEGFD